MQETATEHGPNILFYTAAEVRRRSVEEVFGSAGLKPVHSASPADLLEKLQQRKWDVILLDGDWSPAPVAKLIEVVGAHVALSNTLVVVLTSQAQPLPEVRETLLYDRPIRPLLLLGAMNRMLVARGKPPILQATVALDRNLRRAVRVPLLLPVSIRSGADGTWTQAEVRDVSGSGAFMAAAGGLAAGQNLDLRNLLTGKEAAFRVVWVGDEEDGQRAGLKAESENPGFWWTA